MVVMVRDDGAMRCFLFFHIIVLRMLGSEGYDDTSAIFCRSLELVAALKTVRARVRTTDYEYYCFHMICVNCITYGT